jgi:hypothetical protein
LQLISQYIRFSFIQNLGQWIDIFSFFLSLKKMLRCVVYVEIRLMMTFYKSKLKMIADFLTRTNKKELK